MMIQNVTELQIPFIQNYQSHTINKQHIKKGSQYKTKGSMLQLNLIDSEIEATLNNNIIIITDTSLHSCNAQSYR
jgi:hypothetical protein